MAEELIISKSASREEKYAELQPQIKGLIAGENNFVANLANVASCLKMTFDFLWVGFYLKDSETELVLGPFQGPIACTRIKKGKGVCGSVWESQKTIIVPDVDQFPGHIACSSESRSEVVIPLFKNGEFIGVLDVDSDRVDDFDQIDADALEAICELITDHR